MIPHARFTFHVSRPAMMAALVLATAGSPLSAQETGTPVFHAPYRAFVQQELAGTLSFVEGGHTGVEAQYRRGFGAVDVALRAGTLIRDGANDRVLAGLELRLPLLAEERFPLRGALVTGAGFDIRSDVTFRASAGLSLGRRLLVEKSAVSLVPFVQPTAYVSTIAGDEVEAGVGVGLDLRLSGAFEFRVAGGFGTGGAPEGIAVTATWLW